jgi:CheY-like chemotaxis protein
MESLGSATVLLVEDDEDISGSLRSVLEDEGYHVEVAAHGRAALELLDRIPLPSLALVDLMMPVMDGWQLVEALEAQASLAHMPVAITTASYDAAPRGYRVFSKPLDLDALLQFVSERCPK